ncbi:hypothetical protein [Streptomyces sp. NPDC060366]|uniref:hypothetical protein n=1 Tax=Streptomyces sp. NPDC060366 TaxID=3347105 RepID=UPI00365DCAA9
MTPATALPPEREQEIGGRIIAALSLAGAFCGECGFEPGDRGCPDCERCWARYVKEVLPIFRTELAYTRTLLAEAVEANSLLEKRLQAAETALESRTEMCEQYRSGESCPHDCDERAFAELQRANGNPIGGA